MASSALVAYGAGALQGYASSATACSTAAGGTQIDNGAGGMYVTSMHVGGTIYAYLFASDATGTPASFYGPAWQTNSFAAGQYIYVTAQTFSPAIGTITNLTAGWYEVDLITDMGLNAYGFYRNASADVLAQPTSCAPAASEEINFTTGTYAPNYLTSSTTYTYGVTRTDATGAPLLVEIDISGGIGYSVQNIDYTRPSNAELTLSWAASENSTKTFGVTTLINPAYTSSNFIPYISTASIAGIVGTASYASSSIIYPGTINYATNAAAIYEGESITVVLVRSSGSDGDAVAHLAVGGSAIPGSDYNLTNLTLSEHLTATAVFADGDASYSFGVNSIRDASRGGSIGIFNLTSVDYTLSSSLFYPAATMGTGTAYTLTINNYDTGSLEMIGSGYNIYTASMPITWSVERYSGSDGPVTATIDLIAKGGYAKGGFLTDYTGSSGAFPFNLTWDDGDDDPKTFSILTMDNGGSAVSISPYISSASVILEPNVVTSSAAWITYPGYFYIDDDTSAQTVVEGQSYNVFYMRDGGEVGGLTGTLSYTGTAISGTDYTFGGSNPPDPATNRVWSDDGDTLSNAFQVDTYDDPYDEDNETIIIYLNETSGTIYEFVTTDGIWGLNCPDCFAFDTGSLFSSPTGSTVTILDNESGSVDFTVVSASMTQNSSIIVNVIRSAGGDFAATATINQYSGTAVQGRDYTGLPATVYWNDQETGVKTFTISAVNTWATASAATLGMYFSTLVNIVTGTDISTEEIILTNNVISEGANSYPDISTDFTINRFLNMSAGYKRRVAQVPFSMANKGPPTIRKQSSAYSTSLG
jgi:hypothetical protein